MTREARNALIGAHQRNIDRYCRLLGTELLDHEREYLHKRIVEERLEMERLMSRDRGIDIVAMKSRRRDETLS
jgi:hypothetical protein